MDDFSDEQAAKSVEGLARAVEAMLTLRTNAEGDQARTVAPDIIRLVLTASPAIAEARRAGRLDGIEEAAKWHDAKAAECRAAYDNPADDLEKEAAASGLLIHFGHARAIRSLSVDPAPASPKADRPLYTEAEMREAVEKEVAEERKAINLYILDRAKFALCNNAPKVCETLMAIVDELRQLATIRSRTPSDQPAQASEGE